MSISTRKFRVTVLISGSGSNLSALMNSLDSSLSNCSIVHVLSSKSTAGGLLKATNQSIPNSTFSLVTYKKSTGKTREDYDLALAERIKETRPDLVVLAGWMLILSESFLTALTRDWEESETIITSSTTLTSLETKGTTPYPSKLKKGIPIPIINLHPALPGCFPGAHAIKDAYDAFNEPTLDLSTLSLSESTTELIKSSTKESSTSTKITKTGIMIHKVIPLLDAGEPIVVKEVELKKGESLEDLEERIHKVEHEGIVEAVGIVVKRLADGSWFEKEENL